jgi:hypothetical protein
MATFVPWMKFKYCPNKLFDYCYAFGNGRYLKMGLDSGIAYLTEKKIKTYLSRFSSEKIINSGINLSLQYTY